MEADAQEIWQQIHHGLRAFISKRVANETEAEDIVQDVWLKMQQGLGCLKDQSRLLPWIYQIARHTIIDYYRARARQPEWPIGLASDLESLHPASLPVESSEGSGQLRRELAGCLRPMIERLSKDYRQAVMLVEVEGFTQQASAKRLGLSLSGMKSRVQRGRKQLKQMLDECCLIQLDRRRGVIAYEVRETECDSCDGSTK